MTSDIRISAEIGFCILTENQMDLDHLSPMVDFDGEISARLVFCDPRSEAIQFNTY